MQYLEAFHFWKFVPIPRLSEVNRGYFSSCPQLAIVSRKTFSKGFSKGFSKKIIKKYPSLTNNSSLVRLNVFKIRKGKLPVHK